MTVYVHAKQLGRKARQVAPCPYELPCCPGSLRELICMMVRSGVASYNRRVTQQSPANVLSAEEIGDMSQVGKIAFGIPYGNKEMDPADALEPAIRSFEDGLYRFFVNDTEITQLDAPLELRENDSIAIIRLVMLTGGFF